MRQLQLRFANWLYVLPTLRKGDKMVMMDRLTVMGCLEELMQDGWQQWYSDSEVQEIAKAAFELLKEQEPIEPTINEYGEVYCVCGENVGVTSSNKNLLSIRFKYCPECGRRMKWDGFDRKTLV